MSAVLLAATGPLRAELARSFPSRPFRVDFWDGSTLPATAPGDARFTVRTPRAVARALWAPGQLGVGRAYVSGDLAVADLEPVLELLASWTPPPVNRAARTRLLAAALLAAGPSAARPPAPPAAELPPRGAKHASARDARSVQHHYDISNDFFRLFLDASMTYSCAIFSRGAATLEEAQEAKLELVCAKLGLRPGERVLDVGCGWGSFALHAATRHGARVVGITVSPAQAALARERVAAAGLDGGQVEIRVMDYRDLVGAGERFDAISSIGMVEHVGLGQIDAYARTLAGLLGPGGRLLNHGIARLRHTDPPAGPFSERYVFPDAEPLHVSRVLLALERAGFVTRHVEGFAADYAETLRHWAQRLDEHPEEAERLVGAERLRVWRLYLRAARDGFRSGFLGVYQVLVTRA